MGMGIWGMHFIAMTAFSMGVEISYDFLIVVISLLAAIIGCLQGLYIITQPLVNLKTLIAASITMGGAVLSMHYTGMAAARFKIDAKSLLSPLQSNFLDSEVIGSSVGITVIGTFAIIYIVLLNASWNRSV